MIVSTRSAVHANLTVQLPAVMLAQLLDINTAIAWPNTPSKAGPLTSPYRHHWIETARSAAIADIDGGDALGRRP